MTNSTCPLFFFFFFFQAEDGIRDVAVTGVQTCALPISLAVLIARHLLGAAGSDWELAAGGAAILGHMFPVFLRFKGGKGVATALGVLLAFDWTVGGSLLVVWLMSAAIWRISSLAALLAFGSLPLWVWLFHPNAPMAIFAIGTTVLIAYRHSDNIARLLAGTETTIGAR